MTVTLGLDGSGTVDIVAGGYEDWVKRKNPPRHGEGNRAKRGGGGSQPAPPLHHPADGPPPRAGEDRRKLSYRDQRDLDRLPAEIDRLEREIADAETALHDPDLFMKHPDKFAALTKAIDSKRAEKDAAEARWLEVAEMAEALTA